MSFEALGLSASLANAAGIRGFGEPTPIQAAALPAVLQGRDVLGIAQTGSGKTAAFGLPLLQMLQDARGRYPREAPLRLRGLVLVPTRELAVQVGDVLRGLAHGLPHRTKIVVAVGGVSANPQMMALRGGADLLVATPGRLLDLLEQKALRLDAVVTLVLDEADRLLDLGFADELQRILAQLPSARQNLFFSATFPKGVDTLAAALLRDPVRVEVVPEPGSAPAIVQRAIQVDASRRTQLLRHLVKQEGWGRALVFVATRYAAETVADKLYKNGVYATAFHGDLSQGARSQVLAELKAGRWDLVVTTDLAGRGIDIARLPVVVNYDLPRSAADYVHRIGRTGRGRSRPGGELRQRGNRSAFPADRKASGAAGSTGAGGRLRAGRQASAWTRRIRSRRAFRTGTGRHRAHAAEKKGQAARCVGCRPAVDGRGRTRQPGRLCRSQGRVSVKNMRSPP
ncbi:helicase-like protein [Xylophilus ampelinus]|uniref:Helicase-like protein n=1 Tax=Xylophilus ampelinus TaxID=54067 RepID=A0A318SZM1_9BURK|nr:helicase-like protein [Xylophilus ampelinus]